MSYLPELPKRVPGTVLIVCLCLPTAEDARERLDDALQSGSHPEIETMPELKVVEVRDCNGQTRLEEEENEGCMTELFTTGQKAKEKGWTRVGIVDYYTYRVLCGEVDGVEASMIILQAKLPDENAEAGQLNIVAKRFPLQEALRTLTQDEEVTVCQSIDPFREQGASDRQLKLFDEYGLTLHDWNLPLFQNDSARSRAHAKTVDHVLSLKPSLPIEIVDTIEDELKEPEPLESLTDAPILLRNDKATLEFIALVPLADMAASTAALNDMGHTVNPDMTAVIYPWKHPFLPASRADFWRLWQRILSHDDHPYHPFALFLDTDPAAAKKHAKNNSKDMDMDVIFAERGTGYTAPTLLGRTPLRSSTLIPHWLYIHSRPTYGSDKGPTPPEPRVVEVLAEGGPEARLFVDVPAWRFAGGVPGSKCDSDAHPCFFLTKGDEDKGEGACNVDEMVELLHDNLYDDSYIEEGNGPYAFVPWEEEEDGGMEDVLRLATMCWDEGRRVRDDMDHCIFIDREAWRTKTVLYVKYQQPFGLGGNDDYNDLAEIIDQDTTLDEEAKYKKKLEEYGEGIVVVRANILGEELHMAWANISVANSDFEEFFGVDADTEHYERAWESEEEKRLAFEMYERSRRRGL